MANLVARGAHLLDDDAGETFLFAAVPILGNFSGAEEGFELTTEGGKKYLLRGTLMIARWRLLLKPAVGLVITGPGQGKYRIHNVASDAASWTLTLSSPNHGGRPS